jgi:hypothetical protein
MSDFLSRLLDRAVGRAPVIERRRPSRFEAVADDAGPRLEETAQAENAEQSERVDVPAAPMPRHPPLLVEQRPPAPMWQQPAMVAAVVAKPAGLLDNQLERIEPEGQSIPKAAAVVREVILEKEVHEATVEIRSAARTAETRAAVQPSLASARARHSTDGDESIRSNAHVVPAPDVRAVTLARPATPPVVQPALRPAAIPPPVQPMPQRERSPEPTIHVTIGRIEVRATQASSGPSRPVRPNGPKLSLDDYLRSRNRGAT